MTRFVASGVLLGVLLCANTATGTPPRDRYLGPPRDVAVIGFPLELALSSAFYEPAFGIEVRVALAQHWALTLRPIVVWYVPGGRAEQHGVGVGARVGILYTFARRLAGPFIGLQGGDVETFFDGRRGRTVGGAFLFGYLLTFQSGFTASAALGLGYYHRMDAVSGGAPALDVFGLELGIGWAH